MPTLDKFLCEGSDDESSKATLHWCCIRLRSTATMPPKKKRQKKKANSKKRNEVPDDDKLWGDEGQEDATGLTRDLPLTAQALRNGEEAMGQPAMRLMLMDLAYSLCISCVHGHPGWNQWHQIGAIGIHFHKTMLPWSDDAHLLPNLEHPPPRWRPLAPPTDTPNHDALAS